MDAAVPWNKSFPAEATQAAPFSAIEAVWLGIDFPYRIMSAILLATARPIVAEGIPVRGGVGEICTPSSVFIIFEIGRVGDILTGFRIVLRFSRRKPEIESGNDEPAQHGRRDLSKNQRHCQALENWIE